ncbi:MULTISPECIES: LacI family DNA-binding transcriptional regulator [Enterobacterales]|jgi:LacI family transcriptional regulator|uniref:Transcriptional regulator, LacI family n=1 Tax=Candidatus Pantoea symbiotica TaxID=1884370 RepID=A0A1I4A1G0_9GAMM|nr:MULTISPECIES: LacI family DNA-binding transcriptional regulator [Enterobacterales]MRT26707.1 LacI family DNA-binding transcriptional regulator [Enterobacteriaceae bacterium RIT697]KAJ9430224.1 LacI family DNA-binding transcriptional regulator [Pantoea sp. YR343]MBB3307385.1 LacI family transcriptional regulator [Enterobacter sp. Sphag1F]NYI16010.1 LacI family transcriptional regulator [Enterobacter sp. Sphag71]SFK50192.1 transcriptional regulator, LacI family [Pantoea symbiotica]
MSEKQNGSGRVSLDDVARLSGVSTATVSRVLNGSTTVKASRREAVEKACEELGYVINRAARTLASRRSMTIGAVVPTLATETFSRPLAAFQQLIHEAGYTLLLANSNFDPETELKEVNKLIEYGIDGLMLVGNTHHPKLWERIVQQDIACVQTFSQDSERPCVGYDSEGAAETLAQHLLGLGHQRFAVIVGTPPSNDRISERLNGTRRALQQHGLTLPDTHLIDNAFTMNDARRAVFRLLDAPQPPTAIICGNDLLAFGAMRAASERYLRIPNDISIVGFNDYEYAEHLEHPLTTMRVDLASIGEHAAHYLLNSLNNLPAPMQTQISTELIVRGSSGSVPRQER